MIRATEVIRPFVADRNGPFRRTVIGITIAISNVIQAAAIIPVVALCTFIGEEEDVKGLRDSR